MKHDEIYDYDKHADRRNPKKSKHRPADDKLGKLLERKSRASFKNYIKSIRDAEAEDFDDFEDSDLTQ